MKRICDSRRKIFSWIFFILAIGALIARAALWDITICATRRRIFSIIFFSLTTFTSANYLRWQLKGVDLFKETQYTCRHVLFLVSWWIYTPMALAAIILTALDMNACIKLSIKVGDWMDWVSILLSILYLIVAMVDLVIFIVRQCSNNQPSVSDRRTRDYETIHNSLKAGKPEPTLYLHYYKPVKREGLGLDDIELGYLSLLCVDSHENELPSPEDPSPLPKCCVCINNMIYQDLVFRLPTCTHIIHKKCAEEWLKQEPKCPLCKNDVRRALYITVRKMLQGGDLNGIFSARNGTVPFSTLNTLTSQ